MQATTQLLTAYDRAAGGWSGRMAALGYAAAYRGFVAAHGPFGAATVLDVGCGAGDFAAAWQAERGAGARLTLVDPSPGMLARAAARFAGAVAVCEGILSLRRLAPQEVILCAHVIEHLDHPVAGLAAMRAALAPGGRILLVVSKPHWCNALIWLRWRHRSLAPAAVRRLVAAAGLCVRAEHAFAAGPPARTSRGYLVTHP